MEEFGCVHDYNALDFISKNKNKNNNKPIYFSNILDATSFFTQNQLAVYNLLSSLETKGLYIFETVEPLEMHRIDEETEAINETSIYNKNANNNGNNLLVRYENKICLPLIEYLESSKTLTIYYRRLMDCYKHILMSIDTLVSLQIVHNNIYNYDKTNIMVDCKEEYPLIMKFHLSLLLVKDNLNERYLKQFFRVYQPTYIYWPIEIHILCYLLHKLETNESLSKYNINTIINDVLSNDKTNILKKEALLYFEKYVNMKRTDIISDILLYYWSWDLYSVSCLFSDILKSKYKHNIFLDLFLKQLLVCQRPDPTKRLTANKCLENFEKIIYNVGIDVFLNVVKT